MKPQRGIVYLMYHELELPGRPLCQREPGYVRYIVPIASFRGQMQFLKHQGIQGVNVSEALAGSPNHVIALTFDDGCETDLIAAVPVLQELGFQATFYITVNFLNQPGYLSTAQLRELGDLSFEIGSHSMSHPYLSDLDDAQLRQELALSKQKLEKITGRPVVHFSCPGGRWSQRVITAAREAGYLSLATSRIRTNQSAENSFALGRVAILRPMTLETFRLLSESRGLWKLRLQAWGRAAFKKILGNSLYDRLRERALTHNKS